MNVDTKVLAPPSGLVDLSKTGFKPKKVPQPAESPNKRAVFDRELHRYEIKYVIPRSLLPEIREYIKPFCEPDPYGKGTPPTYVITTLQLDSPGLSLHYAKLWDFVDRFKLRVRTYNPIGKVPIFLEVKSKYRASVLKLRCQIPFEKWGPELFEDKVIKGLHFKSKKEETNFYQFAYLTKQIGAAPVMLIRYHRESYFGKMESYARITFDSNLEYQQTYSWNSWGRDSQWRALDNPMIQTRRHDKEIDYSGVVMELKALNDVPHWMVELVKKFDLGRVGHCKYSNAIWSESLFRATPYTPEYEVDLLQYL